MNPPWKLPRQLWQVRSSRSRCWLGAWAAAAAAKSLQSCPTLCDPIDGSPPGSPIPGILQTRTLEWVAISFSNAWKWKVKGKSLSFVRLLATPWTAAFLAPPSMGFSRQEHWSGVSSPGAWATRCLLGINTWERSRLEIGVVRHGITMQACLSYGASAGWHQNDPNEILGHTPASLNHSLWADRGPESRAGTDPERADSWRSSSSYTP